MFFTIENIFLWPYPYSHLEEDKFNDKKLHIHFFCTGMFVLIR